MPSPHDPPQDITDYLETQDLQKRHKAAHSVSEVFQLTCDAEGCGADVRLESGAVLQAAHDQHLVNSTQIKGFALDALREKAYSLGWVNRRDKDYCPSCVKKGKAPGDETKPGAGKGKRRMKRLSG